MKKQRQHFDIDIPFNQGRLLLCTINVCGVGYFDGEEYDYDIDEVRVIEPKESIDYNPIGVKVPKLALTAFGIVLTEEDKIHNPILNHLRYLFSEVEDTTTDSKQAA